PGREISLPNSALTTLLDTRGTLSTMLRESFTSPHYTLYHYICPLIHTSQGRSKGVFIVLSDGEVRLWRLETPGGSGWSRATWSQARRPGHPLDPPPHFIPRSILLLQGGYRSVG
ncbi:hypothetical protein U9M48_031428, partial [Paspalum notatum var. saurae]